MKVKPVVPREQARRDVEDAVAHYLAQDAESAALGFVGALENAYGHIGRHPASGSPRYAHDLNLPDLRSRPLTRFPYLVFYVECPDRIDVWRVLHGQRDISAWMQEPEGVWSSVEPGLSCRSERVLQRPVEPPPARLAAAGRRGSSA